MQLRTALGELLREIRKEQRKNLRDIATEGYIALGYLSEVENGRKQISDELLESVAYALGTTPAALIIEAGYRMLGSDPSTLLTSNDLELVSHS